MKSAQDPETAGDGGPQTRAGDESTDAGVAAADTVSGGPAAEIERLRAQVEEFKDLYLRARAEADNTRRRAETEIANTRRYAVEQFAQEMLAVRDSLELARGVDLKDAGGAVVEQLVEGLDLTLRLMDTAFARFGIERVEPVKGDRFDPERHQALSAQPSDEVSPNHVLALIQPGYRMHGRLLRPANVIVARAPVSAEPPAGGAQS